MIRGFDRSSVQGPADYSRVDTLGLRFVILKAQEGNGGFDPTFVENVRAAAGLHVLPYCFAYPLEPDGVPGRLAKEQAKLFVDRVRAAWPEWTGAMCLDFEWPAPADLAKWGITWASIARWARACCEEVYRLTGVRPFIYSYPDWWTHLAAGGDVSWASDYPLWIARYVKAWPKDGDAPKLLPPWTTWHLWQWDGDGGERLPNGRDADFCVFNGTEEELAALVSGAPLPAPDFDTVHPAVPLD